MMRASAGDKIILGLSEANIQRLKAGQPIKLTIRSTGRDIDGDILIFYAATESEMEMMCRKAGLITNETKQSVDPRLDQEDAARRDGKPA